MAVDLKTSVAKPIFSCKISGLWPVGNRTLYSIFSWIALTSLALYNITQVMDLMLEEKNLETWLATFFNLMNTLNIQLKFMAMCLTGDLPQKLVALLDSSEFQPITEEHEKILKASLKRSNAIFYFYFCYVNTAVVMFVIAPFFEPVRRLPAQAWFPYDHLEGMKFISTYFFQSVVFWLVGSIDISVDNLFAILAVQAGAQCDILSNSLETLGEGGAEHCELQQLKKCVAHHRAILRFVNGISEVYKYTICIQLFCTILISCTIMFVLASTQLFSVNFFSILTYTTAVFVELSLYCWFANELTIKSNALSASAYNSKWYDYKKEFQKDLAFFMHRTQKPIVIYAANVFPVDVLTLSAIMRSSWAYFMGLRRVNSL